MGVKSASEALMLGIRVAFPPLHPSYDVQITGLKAAAQRIKNEKGEGGAIALAKAAAESLKHIETTTLERVRLVRENKESVKAATRPVVDNVAGFPEVKIHAALHGVSRVANEMDFQEVTKAALKTGAATIARTADILAEVFTSSKAIDILRGAGVACDETTSGPAKQLHKLSCHKAWTAMQPGNRPAVDFQVTGVHKAMKEGGKNVAPKLEKSLKVALDKATELIKAKAKAGRTGKSDIAVLGRKTDEEVEGFTMVHIHAAVHGVSKVQSEADVQGIFDALARALESTNKKIRAVLDAVAV